MEKLHVCDFCEKRFSSRSNLLKHIRNIHRVQDSADILKNTFLCQEKECKESFSCAKSLRTHLERNHGLSFSCEESTFESVDSFLRWKSNFEEKNNCNFGKFTGAKAKGLDCVQYFNCHRSGKYEKLNGTRATGDSCKIGSSCTCSVIAKIGADGTVMTKLFPDHYGHNKDIGFLHLTSSEKEVIVQKLRQNISINNVLKDIRNNLLYASTVSRIHLTTKQDIKNIFKKFKLSEFQRHDDDATSVSLLLDELAVMEYNPVLAFKFQGIEANDTLEGLNSNDVFFVIQHTVQKEMMKEFGNKVICVDSTHGTNRYHFNLITLLVVDEYDEGYPVAFCICNREDTQILKLFFSFIKKNLETEINPKIFMSDDAPAFFNAWSETFGVGSRKLLCAWHIEKNIRKKLNTLIKDAELACKVYKTIISLLFEKDITKFQLLLKHITDMFDLQEETSEFGKYFMSTYGHRMPEIAVCYRLYSGINTNMHIEAFHRDFKYNFLNAKVNHRLDSCIYHIFEYNKCKAIERMTKLERGKISKKVKTILVRHRESENLNMSHVKKVDDGYFEVSSFSSNNIYFVTINNDSCDCHIKCRICNICIHQVSCTCLDFSIRNVLCKHVHLTIKKMKYLENSAKICNVNNALNDNSLVSNQQDEDDNTEKTACTSTKDLHNLLKFKENNTTDKDTILNEIRTQMANLDPTSDKHKIEKAQAMLYDVLKFLTSDNNDASLPQVSEKKVNITRQQSFFRTKKKLT